MDLSRLQSNRLKPASQVSPKQRVQPTKPVVPQKSTPLPSESISLTTPTKPKTVDQNQQSPPTKAPPKPQIIDFKPPELGNVQGQAMVNANGTISLFDSPPSAPKTDEKFTQKYGPWGVVTGASQGIGAEYARAMAEKGLNVVMVARSGEKMTKLAKELSEEHGVKVRVLPADLNTDEGIEQVKAGTKDLKVGLLVNNAGAWQMGSFLDQQIDKTTDKVGLNFGAPLKLSQHFAKSMSEEGKGGILNVGSMAAFHGVPGQAAYSGNKGFLQNLTESLHRELKPQGIDVMITNPGPVKGEASSSEYDQSKIPLAKVSPREVATQSLGRLGKGGSTTVPGFLNRIALGAAVRTMPRDLMSSMAGMLLERAAVQKSDSGASQSVQSSTKTENGQPKEFKEKYGPWAVVTGASQGLGSSYAEQLAKKGLNVVVVARNGEKLDKLSKKLQSDYGVQVKTVAADLSKPEGIDAVKSGTKDLEVGLLVNNAGAWQMGSFLENDIQKDTGNLGLNISAPLQLCHEFGNRMKDRGGGGIINVGSGAAAHGIPGQATYSAGKGFLQNLTESLAPELGKHGIDVLQTNPAAIKGDASSIYDQSKVPLKTLDAEFVVTDSLDKLGKKKKTTPGLFNRVAMGMSGLALSRDQQALVADKILKRASQS